MGRKEKEKKGGKRREIRGTGKVKKSVKDEENKWKKRRVIIRGKIRRERKGEESG